MQPGSVEVCQTLPTILISGTYLKVNWHASHVNKEPTQANRQLQNNYVIYTTQQSNDTRHMCRHWFALSTIVVIAFLSFSFIHYLLLLIIQAWVRRLASSPKERIAKMLVNGASPSLIICTGVQHQHQMEMGRWCKTNGKCCLCTSKTSTSIKAATFTPVVGTENRRRRPEIDFGVSLVCQAYDLTIIAKTLL